LETVVLTYFLCYCVEQQYHIYIYFSYLSLLGVIDFKSKHS